MLYFVSSIIAITIHFKVPCSTHFQLVPYRNGYKVTIQLHVSNALLSRSFLHFNYTISMCSERKRSRQNVHKVTTDNELLLSTHWGKL